MKTIVQIVAVVGVLLMGGCRSYVAAPPETPVVVVPVSPGPNYVWVDGRWRYHRPARRYVYVNGYYADRGRHAGWVDGHWAQTPRGYRYVKGHWR